MMRSQADVRTANAWQGCLRSIRAAHLLGLALALLAGLLATAGSAELVLAGQVTRVIDGDTIDVQLASGRLRVRLHGVDAPESDQPGGSESRSWLANQLRNQQVLLEPVSQDQYDRMVAVVHLGDRNINRELVAQGHAWAYRRYLRKGDAALCELEDEARQATRGIWKNVAARAPWEFRATRGKGPFKSYAEITSAACGT